MCRYSAGQRRVTMDVEFKEVEERIVNFIDGAIDVCPVSVIWSRHLGYLKEPDLSPHRSKLPMGDLSHYMSRMGCIEVALDHL